MCYEKAPWIARALRVYRETAMLGKSAAVVAMVSLLMLPVTAKACQQGQDGVRIRADSYKDGESQFVCRNCLGYGSGQVTNMNNSDNHDVVVYDINIPSDGKYEFEVYMANKDPIRTATLFINDVKQPGKILGQMTHQSGGGGTGYTNADMDWVSQGVYYFKRGMNKIRIEGDHYFPHLLEFTLTCAA
jgi:hypothetical protein